MDTLLSGKEIEDCLVVAKANRQFPLRALVEAQERQTKRLVVEAMAQCDHYWQRHKLQSELVAEARGG